MDTTPDYNRIKTGDELKDPTKMNEHQAPPKAPITDTPTHTGLPDPNTLRVNTDVVQDDSCTKKIDRKANK